MIWHYLYEIIRNNIDDPKELFRILAYIERSTALDLVSMLLNIVTDAKKKGLTLKDLEYALSDLYTFLESEKQRIIMNDSIGGVLGFVLERSQEVRSGKTQLTGVIEVSVKK